MHSLVKFLDKHESILVYGTGKCADYFYKACAKLGRVFQISSFVTSFVQESKYLFHDIPVIGINEIDIDKTVFIATGSEARKEIENFLIQIGVRHMEYMENYLRGEFLDAVCDFFEGKDFRGYCEEIAEWYVYEHPEDNARYNHLVEMLIELGEARIGKKFTGKTLVFIAERIRARHIKFIRELIKNGYKISMLQLSGRYTTYVAEDEINKLGIDIKKCCSVEEILYYVLYSNSNLFYVDDLLGYGYSNLAAHMIKQKKYFGKIIFDPYDIRHGTYTNRTALTYISERYSLEHADGVISRYLNQLNYLKEKFHLKISSPFLEFMDYCEPTNSFKKIKLDNNETLRICWCVTHARDLMERDVGISRYMHTVPVREWLNYVGKRTDYLVDIYVWEANDNQKKIFKMIEEENVTVHFYTQTPHVEFLEMLQSYDYGMNLCVNKEIPKWPESVEGYSENSWINSMVNKYFDFLSAGVPIIADSPMAVTRYFSDQYECLVEMSAKDFDIDYLKRHRKYYKQKALDARKLLAIDKHINKLVDFLECVRGE
mgnify:CR=1 FL=1